MRLLVTRFEDTVVQRLRAQDQVINAPVVRAAIATTHQVVFQAATDRGHDHPRHLVLHAEDILDFTVVTVSPDMLAADRIDQLCGYPHRVVGASHTAFDHVISIQLRSDAEMIDALLLDRNRR